MNFKDYIGITPDFPQAGISFKDISPLLADKDAFKAAVDELCRIATIYKPTVIIGPEARGFVFGTALAYKMHLGFIMARKEGKLPGQTLKVAYELEYGQEVLTIPTGFIKPQDRVLIVDDLLATGGTLQALSELIKLSGGRPVAALTLIALTAIYSEGTLTIPHRSLVEYER